MQSRSTEAQKTARGNEQSSTGVLAAWREANKKRNEAEAKLHTKKREAEAKLTTVYNEHRQQLEKLQMQIQYKKSEQSEIMQQMNRWRTQWEEEMSEKNAVAAELLTLRSEFEKSSGTYDKEIEGLKDMLERTRVARRPSCATAGRTPFSARMRSLGSSTMRTRRCSVR
jgi:chromosome segregation ATPase